jgi:hypothetical protein
MIPWEGDFMIIESDNQRALPLIDPLSLWDLIDYK